ncbi:uncharacterized protein LOC134529746 isoform X2 [Bacillus rossius redtenbacheri]|uniref:uncharacterized protein LOC134529746 isoform X2 n=1 Tax=Bacillus rossius redtenbacheri TaxID=93214 RepID=UPI002FDE6596
MEEKRDKRIGKSGHLWLSARRKKRKATAAIAYQQERKKKRLQEHSKIPEENTSTVINKGNEEWSAPSTSRSESGILNLITGTKILQYEENHHNSQDVDLQEVLSEKPVTQTIVRDNLNSKSYTCLQPVSILHESGCTSWERHEDVAELQCPASVPTCGVSEAPQNTQECSGMSACHVEQCGGLHSSSEDLEKETPVSTVIITNKAHVNNDNEKSLEGNRIVDISFILRKMT